MNKRELIERIIAKVSEDNELLKAVGELTLDMDNCEIAEEQKADTMYVLTGKIRIKSDSDEQQYHYHPIIKDCLLNPNATENSMVCSPDLLELQRMQMGLPYCRGVQTVMIAVKIEVFQKLQQLLDETIEAIIRNTRHAAEIYLQNSVFTAENALDFGDIYQVILSNLMAHCNTVFGSALTDKSEIVERIDGVSYVCDDDDDGYGDEEDGLYECNEECDNCDREYCCRECDDDERDEDDDDDGCSVRIEFRT